MQRKLCQQENRMRNSWFFRSPSSPSVASRTMLCGHYCCFICARTLFSVKTTMQAELQCTSQWGMHRHRYIYIYHHDIHIHCLLVLIVGIQGWCDESTEHHLWQIQRSVHTTQCERVVKKDKKRICIGAEPLIVVQRYCPLKSTFPRASNASANKPNHLSRVACLAECLAKANNKH